MHERLAVLVVVTLLELLGGLGLRNEAQAARARIEVQRRRVLVCEDRLQEVRQAFEHLTAPESLEYRLRRMAEIQAAREAQLPQL